MKATRQPKARPPVRGNEKAIEPRLALSIRQPWAWLILRGFKPLENRGWQAWQMRFTGRVYIHTGKTMTIWDYMDCLRTVESIQASHGGPVIDLPKPEDLERGGIVGAVDITGYVDHSDSPWFFGPRAFTLANPEIFTFTPCPGETGFFTPEKIPTAHMRREPEEGEFDFSC